MRLRGAFARFRQRINAQPIVSGAALNGLLALEDWFFSWPEGLPPVTPFPFDEVASPPGLPGGRRFPSIANSTIVMPSRFVTAASHHIVQVSK